MDAFNQSIAMHQGGEFEAEYHPNCYFREVLPHD